MRPPAPSHNRIRTQIVTTYQQLLHAYAIRSICFMEEHGVPAQHEFDGNDYQATHVIVYSGDEPIGTLRIRWFKNFAKFERTAFRKAYRNIDVLKAAADFSFDHVARKGFDRVITHAQPKYARLWRIVLGFKNAEGKKPIYFEGHDEPYVELVKELTPSPDAISESTDSTVLFRTEGFWDAPSKYERVAQPVGANLEASILVDFFREHLKQVVSIHQLMFQRLLFEEDSTQGTDLAELFHDVGKTYLRISKQISEKNSSFHSLPD